MFLKLTLTLALAVLLLASTAAAEPFLSLEQPGLYDLKIEGFELSRDTELQIDAVGLWARGDKDWVWQWRGSREDDALTVYAWILDSATRRPVWIMDSRDSERVRGSKDLRQVEESLELPAGRYELYLFSGHGWLRKSKDKDYDDSDHHEEGKSRWNWDKLWSGHDEDDIRDLEEDLEGCYVKLTAEGSVRRFQPTGEMEGALIRHASLGDSEFRQSGFELSRESRLRVYSLIEHPKGSQEAADYGWIANADTREIVWQAGDALSRRGGGSRKNRLIDDEVRLDAGRYVLNYGTDDSHSFEEFNANPPVDPLNWGITLLPGDGFDAGAFSTFEPRGPGQPLVEFTRARDEDFFEQPFEVSRDTDVFIHSLGEFDYGGRYFVDYAWIADARNNTNVWEMTGRNTMGAGGADKNRMFSGVVHLPAGQYILFYVTDDSHSFRDWNQAAPFEPEAWGVAMYPGPGASASDLRLMDAEAFDELNGALVRMVRMGNGERSRKKFTLDATTQVHIYAMGEGSRGEMYDLGFILDDRGRVEWEMTWRNSEHAGGARKNRLFDDTITLEAGEYTAVYESDGSHSFAGWNDTRPDDPLNYGITIRRADR